jgi:hypothetical protein
MNDINTIYIGDGLYELETHESESYRWISNKCDFYVPDISVGTISLLIESPIECDIISINGAEIVEKNNKHISLKILNNAINIEFNFFVPQIAYGTNDDRKLSYKLYGIAIDDVKILIENIAHIPTKFFNYSIKKNTIITEYGDYGEMFVQTNKHNINGKINLNEHQILFYSHRSGWNCVIDALSELHNDEGVRFDGFLENVFVWKKHKLLTNNILPYNKPWIGVFHNPPNMPCWFSDNGAHPNMILSDYVFKQSLTHCKGIYVLSQYHANYLKLFIPEIPINVLRLPTEIPEKKFTYEKFINNPNKSILTIGWWLRKLHSFFLLKSPYKKIQILPIDKCKGVLTRLKAIESSVYNIKITDEQYKSVEMIDQLNNDAYDDLLTENIVYLNLYDSSANNVIVECIARGTPILINKLPATIEYLGEDYPFYFADQIEAEKKLNDLALIKETTEYLTVFDNRKYIFKDYFINNFINSSIYKNL